jgi:hypothetical protein
MWAAAILTPDEFTNDSFKGWDHHEPQKVAVGLAPGGVLNFIRVNVGSSAFFLHRRAETSSAFLPALEADLFPFDDFLSPFSPTVSRFTVAPIS